MCAEDPVASSPDVGDLSPEGPLPPLILLQQLLSAATQPSPIKAIFDRQEMEVSPWLSFFAAELPCAV